jgi:hypothetical protein
MFSMTYSGAAGHRAGAGFYDSGAWWLTVPAQRRVLVMPATMASASRLLDVTDLFHGDLRVQLYFTVPPSQSNRGTAELLGAVGAPLLPWEKAKTESFDLALTANLSGLHEVAAPVVMFSHGASRNSLARPRGRGSRPVIGPVSGLGRTELVYAGVLAPTAVTFGHERELGMLAEDCPEALPIASVIGDPCYDRITAQAGRRAAFRRALGVTAGQKLVVVASSWQSNSLIGSASHLLERAVRELPGPQYRVALLSHPNIWAGHGGYQVQSWFKPLIEAGLVVVRPEADWQPILTAADWVIGDHGSVTLYSSVAGVPVMLGAFDERYIHPDSGAAALGLVAPRVVANVPLGDQLAHAAAEFDAPAMARVAATISSEPGAFARTARRLLYNIMGLSQPAVPARLAPSQPPAQLWAAEKVARQSRSTI